ncbi:Alpha/Beta hydrolase protein [Aspergillus spectabilis]
MFRPYFIHRMPAAFPIRHLCSPRLHPNPYPNQHPVSCPLKFSTSTIPPQKKQTPNTLSLPTGRNLEYHTYGDTIGTPIIYIHGTPDSGITLSSFEDRLGQRLGIRWITPDRPGIGNPSFVPNRRVVDFAHDVQFLIQHLNLDRTGYYLLGTSGGTGYTLACAKMSRPRDDLRGVGICAGVGPWRGEEGLTGQNINIVSAVQNPDPAVLETWWKETLLTTFASEDQKILFLRDALQSALKVFRRVYIHGSAAHAEEYRLLMQPWGSSLKM